VADGPVVGVPDLAGGDGRCGALSAASLMECVDPQRIEADVREMAKAPASGDGDGDHRARREWIATRLRQLRFDVELHDYGTGINVIGRRRGLTKPLERVVVGAHYDRRPRCSGAGDNASGVAAALEAARVLASARFDRTLVVAFWDEGERQQKGSRRFAKRANARETRVRAAFTLESVAYASDEPESQQIPERFEEVFPDEALALEETEYRGDFVAVVVDGASEELGKQLEGPAQRLALPLHRLFVTELMKVKVDNLHRSDHVGFWEARYPALLLTDTGAYRNPHFGCTGGDDHPDALDYGFAAKVAALAVAGLAEQLALR
jgi:hypothetical protein